MESRQQEEFFGLIARYLAGSADAQDINALDRWIEESPDNRRYMEQVMNIWNETGHEINPAEIDVSNALSKIIGEAQPSSRFRTFWVSWQKIAAVLLIPMLFGFLALTFFRSNRSYSKNKSIYNEVFAAYGTRSTFRLPDSTLIWLNSGSRLKYPSQFKGRIREVELSGEAYFEVRSEKNHPFIVNTSSIRVSATGTRFDVSCYETGHIVEVTLSSGMVSVTGTDKNTMRLQPVELKPNQHFRYEKENGTMKVTDEDTYKYIGWKDGKIIFRNDPLKDVVNKIGMLFNAKIILQGKELQDYSYRATFNDESLEEILKLLKLSSPINYIEVKRIPAPDGSFPQKEVIIFPIDQKIKPTN